MSKSVMKINIAKDFSKNPAGRYISDGKYSGESFLKNYLIPAVKTHDLVELDFTGVRGYGSSFLEEAFGGLIRLTNMSLKDFMSKISLPDRNLQCSEKLTRASPSLVELYFSPLREGCYHRQSNFTRAGGTVFLSPQRGGLPPIIEFHTCWWNCIPLPSERGARASVEDEMRRERLSWKSRVLDPSPVVANDSIDSGEKLTH